MKAFPIGMICYANMSPYRELGPPRGCEFVPATPTETSRALREGRVLGGAIPVGDLPAHGARVETIGEYGISADGPVGSVLLFSDRPLEGLMPPARVYVTGQSSSSVRLLCLLLRDRLGPANLPRRATTPENAQAELLIGDEALARRTSPHHSYVIDLAAEWCAQTGLPMVFARWVVAADAPRRLKTALRDWLERFREMESELVAAAVVRQAPRLNLSAAETREYLDGMRRVLGPRDLAGQDLFLRRLKELDPGPLFESEEEGKRDQA